MKKKNKGKVKGKPAAAAVAGATVEDGSVEASCGTFVGGESDATGCDDLTSRLSRLEELVSSSKVLQSCSGSCPCASEIQSLRLELNSKIADVKDQHKSLSESLESAVLELKARLRELSARPDLSQHAQTNEEAKVEQLGAAVSELRTHYERLKSKIDQADIDGMTTSNSKSTDENDPGEPDDGTGTTADRTSLQKEKDNVGAIADSSSSKNLDQVDRGTGPEGVDVVAGSVQEGTTKTAVPFSDAPILGAPIRVISFMTQFVTGADLVKNSRDTQ